LTNQYVLFSYTQRLILHIRHNHVKKKKNLQKYRGLHNFTITTTEHAHLYYFCDAFYGSNTTRYIIFHGLTVCIANWSLAKIYDFRPVGDPWQFETIKNCASLERINESPEATRVNGKFPALYYIFDNRSAIWKLN
jgi:hypothetical protein